MALFRPRALLSFVTVLLLILGTLVPIGVQAKQADLAQIDPMILDQMANSSDGTASFFVRFHEQADLSPAYQMRDWSARGQFVYDTLQATADRSQARVRTWLEARGIEFKVYTPANVLFVTTDRSTMEALAAFPEVDMLRGNHHYSYDPIIAEPQQPQPEGIAWGVIDTQAPNFWAAFGTKGTGSLVASIDSGVEYTHDALFVNYKCQSDPGNNVCWEDPDNTCPSGLPCDPLGHGTHTMGTMIGDDDPGLTWNAGMAPDAQWISCNAGSPSDNALLACGQWVLAPGGDPDNRPMVVNNSWGGGGGDTWYLSTVEAWRAAGIFPSFSAGNSYSCGAIGSPGDYQETFAVAAHDSNRNIADFSSKGPSTFGHDPYTKPNISAPGVNVCSSVPGNAWDCTYSGTSMASPHVVGAVALLLSCNPGLIGQIDQIFQILQDNADPPPAGGCGAPPDNEGNYTYGYGYLNIYNAGQLWCGDIGNLAGHVADANTSAPIEGALVSVGFRTDSTDASGYYGMSLLTGAYTVTATAFGYISQVVPNVVIEPDLTTTLDFDLEPAPGYLVSGYVTDAGTGAPLEATIEIVGTPLAPVTSDPGTGYYEVAVPAGTYTFHVTADQHAPLDQVVVVDHDLTQNFALYGFCAVFSDDVEGGNLGWTPGGSPNTWAITTEASHSPTHSWTDSPGGNYIDYADNYIESPVLDLSTYSGVTLNFWHTYQTESGYDYCKVEFSTDGGGSWFEAASWDGSSSGWENVNLDLADLDGQANARIRFHFTSDISVEADGWHVDDIILSGGGPGCAPDAPPVASFESTTPACNGEEVAFTDTSFGGNPPADQFLWDFGDGITSTLQNPVHTYAGVGSYDVSFQLCNTVGCDDVTGAVEVLPLPVADFDYQADGLDVTFTNLSTEATAYLWSFGDGATSTETNPVHSYAWPGAYTVTLAAYSGCGSDTAVEPITLVLYGPPMAGFTADPIVGCVPLEVTFADESYGDPPIDSWLWTFGDGATSTETNPVHTYIAPGEHLVVLTVENISGTDSAEMTVTVNPLAEASFEYDPAFGGAPLTVWFTDTSINAISPTWAFGDGTVGSGAVVSHTYANPGDYNVTLTVGSPYGCGPATAAALVRALEFGPPVAGFTADPVEGCMPLAVTFTDESYGAPPVDGWLWAFGDGTTSTETNPTHEYTASGEYEVLLTVESVSGTAAATTTIIVNPVPEALFTYSPAGGEAPLVVTFTNGSTDAISPTWAFGDSGVGAGDVVTHTFTAAGVYTVTLTVQSPYGCNSDTYQLVVTVTEQPTSFSVYLPLVLKNH